MIRDLARDEAIAIAKACSHPTVELRHVLWGLVHVLGPAAPAEVPLATVKAFLQPEGSSYVTPVVTPEAEAALAAIETEDDAKAAVLDIAKRLAAGDAPPAGGSTRMARGPRPETVRDADWRGSRGRGRRGRCGRGRLGCDGGQSDRARTRARSPRAQAPARN